MSVSRGLSTGLCRWMTSHSCGYPRASLSSLTPAHLPAAPGPLPVLCLRLGVPPLPPQSSSLPLCCPGVTSGPLKTDQVTPVALLATSLHAVHGLSGDSWAGCTCTTCASGPGRAFPARTLCCLWAGGARALPPRLRLQRGRLRGAGPSELCLLPHSLRSESSVWSRLMGQCCPWPSMKESAILGGEAEGL